MSHEYDATSAALIRAAHTILESAGPEALTVRRIAAEAGMSTMNVYSRFEGKHGVIDELYADGFRRLAAQLQAVPTTDDVVHDILSVMDAYRRFAIDNPTYYRVMFRSATLPSYTPSSPALAVAFTCLQSMTARVELAQARGDVATFPDWSAQEIAAWLWANCHGLVSVEASDVSVPAVSWATVFDHGARTAVHGLHPSVAPAPA
ncbi:MAG TPA: TetR/AcrR family transcriptional regulator [Ilumatobacter sp.]|nr:TetR/AcrR family transcriptional regulator [Ilumatobacter sp.]